MYIPERAMLTDAEIIEMIQARRRAYQAAFHEGHRIVIALRGCMVYGDDPLLSDKVQLAHAKRFYAREATSHIHRCKCGATWE